MQHRFYGKSVPFGTIEEAWKNATLRGYFSSAQAIADYAEVILSLKKNLSAEASPVIVSGGSYGGSESSWFIHNIYNCRFWILSFEFILPNNLLPSMFVWRFWLNLTVLAVWFRLKYPHIAIGALASSAPILYFDNITPSNAYYATVSADFKVKIKAIFIPCSSIQSVYLDIYLFLI